MMATTTPSMAKIIAVIGATGTGKSQLAVDLALKFDGEIINCDAVQMYKGLPIITNKITINEQQGVPHHLLGTIQLEEPTWTVGQFVSTALRTIEDIRGRGKLPILVGGTHYYVQSLLVKDSIIEQSGEVEDVYDPILQESTETLLKKLREVDPIMADRWHPNERRKIQRSLQIWMNTGRRASELYAEQKKMERHGNAGTNGLRFDPLVFWVHAAADVLKPRLDSRVLKMIDNGLLDEVQSMYDFKSQSEENSQTVDLTKGIWVSIGFKEFSSFIAIKELGQSDKQVESMKKEAIERTQVATRQYAKRQLRWVQFKFLNAMIRNNAANRMFLLDGSQLSQWDETVRQPAMSISEQHIANRQLPNPSELSPSAKENLMPKGQDLSHATELWEKRTCEYCGVVAVTVNDWEKHIQSSRHKKVLASRRRKRDAAERLKHKGGGPCFPSNTTLASEVG
jgi:tRNA dimethylallyltransferase